MLIYIAAPFEEWRRAKWVAAQLQELGHVITAGWIAVAEEREGKCAGGLDVASAEHARADLLDITRADALLVLTTGRREQGCGMWIELGYALGLGRRVVVTGEQRNRSIFCALAEATFATDQEAIRYFGGTSEARA